MRNNKFNFLVVLSLILAVSLACGKPDAKKIETLAAINQTSEKLDGYTLRGIKFSYYKIPSGLEKNDLIKTARELHQIEPDANLILVDDATRVSEYIKYAQSFGKGTFDAELPKEWADKHVVANVQQLTSGKWQLCEGYGYREIADLE